MKTEVIEIPELSWTFGNEQPHVQAPWFTPVDPFPCYPHDVAIVGETLQQVETELDIALAPRTIYVLHHETVHRTNGWASADTAWDEEKQKRVPGPGTIVLSGKRIPPHPAVTRYLVAHEYGHHVDYDICARRGVDTNGLDEEYAKLRGLPDGWEEYGGRRWHSNVGEIIANDFRVLWAEVEPDYWPHAGVDRPEHVPGLVDWWSEQLA